MVSKGDDDRVVEVVLDTPIMRAFVAGVQASIADAVSPQDACAAIEPRFAELLADSRWLPDEYQAAAPESGMGGGIGQWLLGNPAGPQPGFIGAANAGAMPATRAAVPSESVGRVSCAASIPCTAQRAGQRLPHK